MTIRHQTWQRFTRISSILALPVVLFLFVQPDWGVWSHRLEIVAYGLLFSVCGAGALLAILMRAGVVRMIYSDADQRTTGYKLSKLVAKTERSQQRGFSNAYYESLNVKSPKQTEAEDKSET